MYILQSTLIIIIIPTIIITIVIVIVIVIIIVNIITLIIMLYCLECSERPIYCRDSMKCVDCAERMERIIHQKLKDKIMNEEASNMLRIYYYSWEERIGKKVVVGPEDWEQYEILVLMKK